MVNSRKMEPQEREKASVIARQVFEAINEKYRTYLLSGFDLARGDGFEAVLFAQYKAPRIIMDIIKALYPSIRIRVSVALGELDTLGNTDRVNTIDGPAFHMAVDALPALKKCKSDHWLQLSIQTNREAQPLIQATLSLLTALTSRWTDKQRATVWEMERLNNYDELARKMGITASAVRKHLKAADYEAYCLAWSALEKYLADMDMGRITPSDEKPGYTTYLNAAYRHFDAGELAQAENLANEALVIAKAKFGENDPKLAPIYNVLGEILLKDKRYSEAITVLNYSLSVQAGLSIGREEMLLALMFLGLAQYNRGDISEAEETLSKGKDIEKAIRGDYSPHLFDWNIIEAKKK